MREWQRLSHVKWYCRYHVVIVPKYRKKVIFGTLRKGIGKILRELCEQEGIELVEGRVDVTVLKLLDGTRAYLHAVIDNYSRKVLA